MLLFLDNSFSEQDHIFQHFNFLFDSFLECNVVPFHIFIFIIIKIKTIPSIHYIVTLLFITPTARKTVYLFSQYSEKMVFLK